MIKLTPDFTWVLVVVDVVVHSIAILVVVLGPLAVLFSLNTLFPALAIPYTFNTWLASFFLMATITAKKSSK